MSVALPPACRVSGVIDHAAPLAVAGTVHGRQVEALVADLPDVLAYIAGWTEQDPDAIGCWGLRADYSGSLTLLLRHKAGAVAERQRAVHLVRHAVRPLRRGEPARRSVGVRSGCHCPRRPAGRALRRSGYLTFLIGRSGGISYRPNGVISRNVQRMTATIRRTGEI